MKKFAIALAALAVMAAAASAAVYSQNAVGFINVDVKSNELVALTFPFNDMNATDGTILFKDTQLAKDAPNASYAYFWTGTSWDPVIKGRQGFNTTKTLGAGEMFFFRPAGDMVITMSGEVPDEASIDVMVKGDENISAIGNPYPVTTEFKTSALASNAPNASVVYFWTGTSWDPVIKGRQGFNTAEVLEPGEGFFFKMPKDAAEQIWTVTKQYDFP